ncbi:tetrathionate reductase family octaheme c-type cytochrome [Propionivibrio dicarboxylicus]|uniref:Octaheme c-type cytochrome, tetrathionate reductase family n=1 Tax=Propionivibrio dicarboxylicus TaxID=83767 RepID=A0A1G8AFW7_9RHOO|nr:tetrathionate reductase family octaheme c-type cytochrome [Propionivibrio dicarboxylicus]SDH19864.1 octaheme c-type cytochrome, tetrathionate reductase family [Propionivibrio dicarboxylicus]
MKRIWQRVLFAVASCIVGIAVAVAAESSGAVGVPKSTADHSKFKELQREFASGQEVTKACLSCHTEAAKQIHQTQHWKWEVINPQTQQKLGKRHVINNYCTSATSNFKACASCHIGYGMSENFDFASQENVDCLACHDTTGKYTKPSGFAGAPVTKDTEFPPGSGKIIKGTNLTPIAQAVGKTRRQNCGNCHFTGGGGDGVKHGDLDTSLEKPDRDLDVHMAKDGLNFSCATCHKTDAHQVPGSRYAPTGKDGHAALMPGNPDDKGRNVATCQSCHGQAPHKQAKLNDHTDKVACQTCHIPEFARGDVPTKMRWDWSTAGKRDKNGKPLVVKDDDGYDTYLGIKGDFVWGTNVKPDYIWMNGVNKYTLAEDKIEKSAEPIYINKYEGSARDGKSLIWPIKTFTGKQPFDPVNKTLVVTHLAGADDTAFWANLDWEKAVASGMKTAGRPFSGKVDFIETVSQWPITHMVAPKEKALACVECHSRNGRLAAIDGVYIPGRDAKGMLDMLGWGVVLLAFVGSLGHGLMRIVSRRKN